MAMELVAVWRFGVLKLNGADRRRPKRSRGSRVPWGEHLHRPREGAGGGRGDEARFVISVVGQRQMSRR
jgi:hypothetical protein